MKKNSDKNDEMIHDTIGNIASDIIGDTIPEDSVGDYRAHEFPLGYLLPTSLDEVLLLACALMVLIARNTTFVSSLFSTIISWLRSFIQ